MTKEPRPIASLAALHTCFTDKAQPPALLCFRAQAVRCTERLTKGERPKPFYEAELADASGAIKLKAWSDSPAAQWCKTCAGADRVAVVDVVEVTGTFTKGDFGLESADWNVRSLTDEERQDFFLGSPELRAKQVRDYDDIVVFIQGMRDLQLQSVCVRFLQERGAEFRRAAAARSNHHARPGGLVEHVAGMMRAASAMAQAYGETLGKAINRDLLIAGVLFHDCGKIYENQYVERSFQMPFTLFGELLGHIPAGVLLVENLWGQCETADMKLPGSEPWPHEKLLHLLHLILSHHGTKEWGSPVEPRTYEAFILHYVDNLDARMEMVRQGFATARRVAPGITERCYPMPSGFVETPVWEQ